MLIYKWLGEVSLPVILFDQLSDKCDDLSDDCQYQCRDLQLIACGFAALLFAVHVFTSFLSIIIHALRAFVNTFSKKIC